MPAPLKTEVSRPFSSGFTLWRKDAEDIHTLLDTLMQAAGPGAPPKNYVGSYEVRLRYGAIRQRASLQDIFDKEPNGKEQTIEGLKITMEDMNAPKERGIVLQFSNVRNLPNPSIYYNIVGTDEAWVNDTDTKLAARIQGVKTFSFDRLVKQVIPEGNGGLILFLLLIFTIGPLLVSPFIGGLLGIVVVVSALALLFYLLTRALLYFFPSYNFCWESYETSFKKRRGIGVGIFTVIILGLAVSLLASFIYDQIKH